jgi:hypothetical protein
VCRPPPNQLSRSEKQLNAMYQPQTWIYYQSVRLLRAQRMSEIHCLSLVVSLTVRRNRMRPETNLRSSSVISEKGLPSSHMYSYKNVEVPLPTPILVDAANTPCSSFENLFSKPCHGRMGPCAFTTASERGDRWPSELCRDCPTLQSQRG